MYVTRPLQILEFISTHGEFLNIGPQNDSYHHATRQHIHYNSINMVDIFVTVKIQNQILYSDLKLNIEGTITKCIR